MTQLTSTGSSRIFKTVAEPREQGFHSIRECLEIGPEIVHLQQQPDFGPFGTLVAHLPYNGQYHALRSLDSRATGCGWLSHMDTQLRHCVYRASIRLIPR